MVRRRWRTQGNDPSPCFRESRAFASRSPSPPFPSLRLSSSNPPSLSEEGALLARVAPPFADHFPSSFPSPFLHLTPRLLRLRLLLPVAPISFSSAISFLCQTFRCHGTFRDDERNEYNEWKYCRAVRTSRLPADSLRKEVSEGWGWRKGDW